MSFAPLAFAIALLAAKVRTAGVPCTVRMGTGETGNEIARIAQEETSDLIVTGSHGHSLIGRLIHGSTISELRTLTSIPIFTFRVSGRTGIIKL